MLPLLMALCLRSTWPPLPSSSAGPKAQVLCLTECPLAWRLEHSLHPSSELLTCGPLIVPGSPVGCRASETAMLWQPQREPDQPAVLVCLLVLHGQLPLANCLVSCSPDFVMSGLPMTELLSTDLDTSSILNSISSTTAELVTVQDTVQSNEADVHKAFRDIEASCPWHNFPQV